MNYGTGVDGLHWAEILGPFGGEPEDKPTERVSPGAESWSEYVYRVSDAFNSIIDSSSDLAIVIGHSETIRASFYTFLKLDPTAAPHAKFVADLGSITRWKRIPPGQEGGGGKGWSLVGHNDISHFDGMRHVE
jgi:broad specificity phosphatase PhoE